MSTKKFDAVTVGSVRSFQGREEFGRGRIAGDVAHVEDEIIFMEPDVVKLDQRGTGALDFLFDDFLREAGEIGVTNPAAGDAHERIPVTGKWQFEHNAQHTVIVVLDLDIEPFAALQDQGFDPFDDGSTFEADVSGRGVLAAGLLSASSKDVTQCVEG